MSIQTPGQIEANALQTTASVAAGFVKNDASGNLLFGEAASAWDLIQTQDFATQGPVGTPVSFSGLNGDVDETYQLIIRSFIASGNGGLGQPSNLVLKVNGDPAASSNLYRSALHDGGTLPPQGYTTQLFLWRQIGSKASFFVYGRWVIHAKSDNFARNIHGRIAYRGNSGSGSGQNMVGCYRHPTANIVSLEVHLTLPTTPLNLGNRIQADSSFSLYKIKKS